MSDFTEYSLVLTLYKNEMLGLFSASYIVTVFSYLMQGLMATLWQKSSDKLAIDR